MARSASARLRAEPPAQHLREHVLVAARAAGDVDGDLHEGEVGGDAVDEDLGPVRGDVGSAGAIEPEDGALGVVADADDRELVAQWAGLQVVE